MKNLIVKRHGMSANHPTISDVYFDGVKVCSIVEKPWKENKPQVSCIPLGVYPVSFLKNGSPSFKYPCFLLKNVPGRSAIMIHRANKESELRGCLAPNMVVSSAGVGSRSTEALGKLVALYNLHKFENIEIVMA